MCSPANSWKGVARASILATSSGASLSVLTVVILVPRWDSRIRTSGIARMWVCEMASPDGPCVLAVAGGSERERTFEDANLGGGSSRVLIDWRSELSMLMTLAVCGLMVRGRNPSDALVVASPLLYCGAM